MTTRIPNPERGADNRAAMGVAPDECREIAQRLSKAFVWLETAEGHKFWLAISKRLMDMARYAESNPPPPPLPDPPARPSSLAASCDIRDWLDEGANGIDVEHHAAATRVWSVYLLVPFGRRREWIADYEIGTNGDQYTAEEAEALAYEHAERLLEVYPQLRAHGINPKE